MWTLVERTWWSRLNSQTKTDWMNKQDEVGFWRPFADISAPQRFIWSYLPSIFVDCFHFGLGVWCKCPPKTSYIPWLLSGEQLPPLNDWSVSTTPLPQASTNRDLRRLFYNLRDLSIQEAELGISHKSFGGYELKYVWKNSQENFMCKNQIKNESIHRWESNLSDKSWRELYAGWSGSGKSQQTPIQGGRQCLWLSMR